MSDGQTAEKARVGAADPDAARAAIESYPHWYHVIDLAPGIETPGWFDLRPIVDRMPWPDLKGKRCLDVGTFDGFLAFEMLKRGASSVSALDIADPAEWDWPLRARKTGPELFSSFTGGEPGTGFKLANELFGNPVERIERNVYDINPADMGKFDVVLCGSLMLHLRDPVKALEAIRSVCDGVFLSAEAIDLQLTVLKPKTPAAVNRGGENCQWWVPNRSGHRQLLRAAGFDIETTTRPYSIPLGPGHVSEMRGGSPGVRIRRTGKRIFSTGPGVVHVASLSRPVPGIP